ALEKKSATEQAGAHPAHGSSTGDNFSVNLDKGLWHCFRHTTGGDALSLIAVCEGLVACEAAKPGALDDAHLFRRVLDVAQNRFGMALAPAPMMITHPLSRTLSRTLPRQINRSLSTTLQRTL